MKMAIPAYFSATSPYWTLQSSGGPVGRGPVRIAVMNPDSGPGIGGPVLDPGPPDPDYVNTVNNTKAAGVRVLGYVSTDYGDRSLSAVTRDIDLYYKSYNVDGVFLDEAEYRDCTDDAYYQTLYNHIKAKGAGQEVILNPGTQTEECYADSADVIVNFEGTYDDYVNAYDNTEPAWVHNYPPWRFWHLVHSAPDEAAMREAVRLGKQRGAYYMYVTPDEMPNPWNILPSEPYWSEELTALSSFPEIRVYPYRLEFFSRPSSPSDRKWFTLTSTFDDPVTVTIEDPTVDIAQTDSGGGSGEFSSFPGSLTVTRYESLPLGVIFTGESGNRPGSVSGSLRVRWDSGEEIIELLGSLNGPEAVRT